MNFADLFYIFFAQFLNFFFGLLQSLFSSLVPPTP
jgi:hypothetical protein